MHKIIETIRDQKVPVNSVVAAAQHLGLNGIGQLNDDEYVRRIKEITGKSVKFESSDMARMTYSYLVAVAIEETNHTDILDAEALLKKATEKASKLVEENSWMFAKAEAEPKLDASGNVKPKKGAKKELAMKVYAEDIKDKVTVRKDAIAILVEKVGMTPAGASTYYANLKKNNGVL